MIEYVIGYLILINLMAFLRMGWDKRKAKKGTWRTSEASLLFPGLLGGIFGVIVGMRVFHHKTRKWAFKGPAYLILVLTLVVVGLVVYYGI